MGRRIAVVHDFLYTYAGAERVLEQILALYPEAELFCLIDFLPDDRRGFIQGKSSTRSFIQKMPWAKSKHRWYFPLMPLAVEQLDVSGFDLVISSSYLAAKGVLTRPDQLHVCYCHSPVRFAWDLQEQYLKQTGLSGGLLSSVTRALLHYLRIWDVRSSNGVDVFAANSRFVARRVEKTYRRGATVVYPPAKIGDYDPMRQRSDFYLTACRQVPYKRVDVLIDAFARMPERKLIVVGTGPDHEKLKKKATRNVEMLGHVSDAKLRELMETARAFLYAAEEDFGIVMVEAQAAGAPVVALGRGGAGEIVRDGTTGVLFKHQNADEVMGAVKRFEAAGTMSPTACAANAARFSVEGFRREFSELVETAWSRFEGQLAMGRHSGPELEDEAVEPLVGVGTISTAELARVDASAILTREPVTTLR